MVITSNLNLCKEVCSGYNLEYVIFHFNPWIVLWVKIVPFLSKYFIDIYSYLTFKAFNNKHFEALLVKFTRRCILYLTYEYRKVKLAFSIKFYRIEICCIYLSFFQPLSFFLPHCILHVFHVLPLRSGLLLLRHTTCLVLKLNPISSSNAIRKVKNDIVVFQNTHWSVLRLNELRCS